jgi:hypothetical protein
MSRTVTVTLIYHRHKRMLKVVSAWVPSRVTPIRMEWPSVFRPLLAPKRRPQVKSCESLAKNRYMFMSPEGTRNQHWLCWQASAAIYPTDDFYVPMTSRLPDSRDNKKSPRVPRDSAPRMTGLYVAPSPTQQFTSGCISTHLQETQSLSGQPTPDTHFLPN